MPSCRKTAEATYNEIGLRMELTLTGGWFAYTFRMNHGPHIKLGRQGEVRRNSAGALLIRVTIRRSQLAPHINKDGSVSERWTRSEQLVTFPLPGRWYVEGMDPRKWKKGRRTL